MSSFPMDLDAWLPLGSQLTLFDAPTFDLLAERSDDCDYRLFDDDIAIRQCHDSNFTWSSDVAVGFESSSSMTLASSPEQYDLFVMPENVLLSAKQFPHIQPPSPLVPELPRSPENYFTKFISNQPITEMAGLVPTVANPLGVLGGVSVKAASGYLAVPCPKLLPATDLEVAAYDRVVVPDIQELDGVAGGEEDMLFELDDVDSDVVIDQEKLASIGPFLTPVSLDDVLSLLPPEVPSSSPQSDTIMLSGSPVVLSAPCSGIPVPLCIVPAAAGSPGPFLLDKVQSTFDHTPTGSPGPCGELHVGYTPLGSPVSVNSSSVGSPAGSVASSAARRPTERRQRKKEQNKTAAQRYREKKRSEHGTVLSEYELLEKRNEELRTKVQDMTKEIAYLKGLIEEICA